MIQGVYRINILAAIFFFVLTVSGCMSAKPVAHEGHGVVLAKADVRWIGDFGPERSGHFRSLSVADFNNDGKLDILGGSYEPGDIFYWLGDGFGNWERKQRFHIRADIKSLASGDINNDGWIDIVSSSSGDTKGLHVWLNKNGIFEPFKPVTEKELYEGIKLADINNDGMLDIIAANSSDTAYGGIQVWLGDGKGAFLKETGPTRDGTYKDIAVVDINNDGKLDIVGAAWGADRGGIRVWLGVGDGRWYEMPVVDRGSFWGVDAADIDGDGNSDIIAASNFDGVKVYYGDGKGNFTRKEVLAEKGSFWKAKACDLNGDGLLDIAAASNDNNGIIVWYQQRDKDRKWAAIDEGLPGAGFYFEIACRDLNNDGKIDIAASTHAQGVRLWFNRAYRPPEVKVKKEKEVIREKEIVEKVVEKEKLVEIEKEKIHIPMLYYAVFFDDGKADLRPETIVVLNAVADFVKKNRGIKIKLEGHADPRRIATTEFPNNQILSERRAKMVSDYLAAAGTPKENIEIAAFGDTKPSYKGDDPASRQKNRRVDITLIYTGGDQQKSSIPDSRVKDKDNKEDKKIKASKNHRLPDDDIHKNLTMKESVIHYPTIMERHPCIDCHKGMKEAEKKDAEQIADVFGERMDLIPVIESKVFKEINNVPEYRIGRGDTLEIGMWEGIKEHKHNVAVSPQGTVTFSYIKNFKVIGLTQTEAEMEFTKVLQSFIKDPLVKVGVKDKRSHYVSIFGAVRDLPRQPTGPGTYIIYGKERITELLSRVGGYLPTADLTRVQLTRDRKTYLLNLYDALFKADFRQDVHIDDGDVIFIPSKAEIKNKVFVFGEVMRPGLFTYDATMSILEAIVRSGGPTFYAKTDEVVIIRGDETKPEAVTVNFKELYQRGDFRHNISLKDGDIVYVAKNTIGNIRDIIRTISPILSILRLPMDVYSATSVPIWEGFPLRRPAAPTPTTILTAPPALPPDGGAWDMK